MATALSQRDRPARRPITADEYQEMARVGILKREERVELIEGDIVAMAPIGNDHHYAVIALTRGASPVNAEGRAVRSIQGPLRLHDFSELEPDLLLLRPALSSYRRRLPVASDVLLLIEVAGSSLAYDRGSKLALYAQADVPEVRIVDLEVRYIEVCRAPSGAAYTDRRSAAAGALAASLVPECTSDVEAILP